MEKQFLMFYVLKIYQKKVIFMISIEEIRRHILATVTTISLCDDVQKCRKI